MIKSSLGDEGALAQQGTDGHSILVGGKDEGCTDHISPVGCVSPGRAPLSLGLALPTWLPGGPGGDSDAQAHTEEQGYKHRLGVRNRWAPFLRLPHW